MDTLTTRLIIALLLASGLAFHGYRKKSLDVSGAAAAVVVGFVSFAVSYRMGAVLIVFYYTGSKMTKVREDVKERYEFKYKKAGQRGAVQVLANSILASMLAVIFYYVIGEDTINVEFNFGREIRDVALRLDYMMHQPGYQIDAESTQILRKVAASYIWILYVAHYACANGDTWASELGILSKSKPRLITTLFTREVPRGTNGGVTVEGTIASGLGGAIIGLVFYLFAFIQNIGARPDTVPAQYPMVVVGMFAGLAGSFIDSLLGASLQATYYNSDTNQIVKGSDLDSGKRMENLAEGKGEKVSDIKRIQGVDVLSNEAVNFWSIVLTMSLTCLCAPEIFRACA